VLAALGVGVLGLIIGGAIGATGKANNATSLAAAAGATTTVTETAAAEPAPTVTVQTQVTVTAKPAGPSGTIPGDGTFIPGVDFPAGTYRTTGTTGIDCYWARLSNLTGQNDILANNNVTGPTVVTIRSSDKGFETSGCEDWKRIK
jgi:hypothetical protein